MTVCQAEGRVEGTLKWYRRGLNRLYDDLPEDKTIRHGTLERWREKLVKAGYAPSTINSYLSVNNAYLDFVGHREYQLANQLKLETELQPELSRTEYLRLLQTARTLGREKVYLLVKLFGTTGLTVQELEKVTVEAVKDGKLTVIFSRNKQVLRIPEGLQKELLDYAKRNGYLSGPIFLTKEGTPMSRTYVSTIIRQLCTAAKVPEEKGNPRCLKRLYQSTRAGIEDNIALLVEQAHSRLLEQEQLEIGWTEQ
jgi:site-specific recombinase XerD